MFWTTSLWWKHFISVYDAIVGQNLKNLLIVWVFEGNLRFKKYHKVSLVYWLFISILWFYHHTRKAPIRHIIYDDKRGVKSPFYHLNSFIFVLSVTILWQFYDHFMMAEWRILSVIKWHHLWLKLNLLSTVINCS